MEIELLEIRDFLAARPPFDILPDASLDELPRAVQIRYLRQGSPFPPPDAEEGYLYIVRTGAIELRDAQGNLLEKLSEGDQYANECTLMGANPEWAGASSEDTLLYLLPCSQLRLLRKRTPEFGRHFSESLKERLKSAVKATQEGDLAAAAATPVSELLSKAPVIAPPEAHIRDVAQIMYSNNVSSVLIVDHDRLLGILTDRDLRSRCVAAGLSTERPAKEIMTTELETIEGTASVIEALLLMTRQHIHHLPVFEDGKLAGVVTATDLARYQSANAAYIVTDIARAPSVEVLARASRRLPEVQVQLVRTGTSAYNIGQAISHITDSLTQRLIALAEESLGPPPVPYAWLAFGSQARREQTVHSDQDNALLISDDMRPEDDAWFEALARFVNDGLAACGFEYCPGEIMASTPKWRQPERVWRRYFDTWIDKPEPKALMLSSIFFDPRVVHGEPALLERLQGHYLSAARANTIFIAYMAANALQNRPPLGFFRGFVMVRDGVHDRTLDLKHRGIVPITDLARVHALSSGITAVNTTDRLRTAAGAGALSMQMAENLEDAMEFIAWLRIQHQAKQIRAGKAPDNYLPPADLSELERLHLKDAFRVIQQMQETLVSRYQLARFR